MTGTSRRCKAVGGGRAGWTGENTDSFEDKLPEQVSPDLLDIPTVEK